MTSLDIQASERFLKAYQTKASIGEQWCAVGAIHDFVRSYLSNPETSLRRYDRVAGVTGRVFECDTSGSGRLLFHFEGQQLRLLDLGHKDIVPRYTDKKLAKDLVSLTEAPQQFWPEHPSGFFYTNPDPSIETYGYEMDPEWLYWLDEDQQKIIERIQEDLLYCVTEEDRVIDIILGGPGTGKSSILLNLLKTFVELDVGIAIKVSSSFVEYVRTSVNVDLNSYRLENFSILRKLEILLVDDPTQISEIENFFEFVQKGNLRALVIAFDPLQLHDELEDDKFSEWVNYKLDDFYILKSSYRQKENVGKAAKSAADQIAKSTPFLNASKIESFRDARKYLTTVSNELVYRNPKGYVEIYTEPTVVDVIREVQRINKPGYLWKHWYNLLVIEERQGGLHEQCYIEFNKLRTQVITPLEIPSIKGLEYQNVFLFISKTLYEQVNYGFKGSGQNQYRKRRLLRIPFSRAKDSLVTFVLNQELSKYFETGF